MDKLKEISKAVAATIGALGLWGATAAADGNYSGEELWGLCGVIVLGLGVWAAPRNHDPIRPDNKPDEIPEW